jgi:hypothetical protein
MSAYQPAPADTKQYRSIEILRGAWGVALLAIPDRILGAVHGLRIDTRSRTVARILGARHLTQAALSGYRPSPEVLAMGVWVDTVHALTALGLAAGDHRRIRAGLADTAIAATWAAAGYQDLDSARATPARRQRVRDQLAVTVLARMPGGRLLQRQVDKARRR